MGMLDRYKKKGGFVQLLNLIETTPSAKAEKFLSMIAEENPAWEAEIRKKCLSIKKLSSWPQTTLMEVMPRVSATVVGSALSTLPTETQEIFLQALSFSDRRKVDDYLKDAKINPAEASTSQMKLLTETRNMITQGYLKIDKIDPDMMIPENIEEMLASGFSSTPTNFDNHSPSTSASTSEGPTVTSSNTGSSNQSTSSAGAHQEELMMLRKKIMSLTQENQLLKQQLQVMKEKLDAVRKAAA